MMNDNDELTTFRKFNAFGGPIRRISVYRISMEQNNGLGAGIMAPS